MFSQRSCTINGGAGAEQALFSYATKLVVASSIKLTINEKLADVKVLWYTCAMKPADHLQTTALPAACATTPMGCAIRLLGDPWILLIVITLLPGSRRFNELRKLMGHISPRTLSQRLKTLEDMQFVERRAFLEIPPRVEYHLTAKGQALGDVIGAIERFAQEHLSRPDVPSSASPSPRS
jgi:DNA-binding HxlR family transcriptional regulator